MPLSDNDKQYAEKHFCKTGIRIAELQGNLNVTERVPDEEHHWVYEPTALYYHIQQCDACCDSGELR